MLQLGGWLGIAGFSISLLIFLVACFGFGAALYLSPLPLMMGLVGMVCTIVGGVLDEHAEGPAVLAGLFINLGAIVGALLEIAAWRNWQIFV